MMDIENSLFFLEYLANEDSENIESDDHEFYADDDENGGGVTCSVKITELAKYAASHITGLQERLSAAESECINAKNYMVELSKSLTDACVERDQLRQRIEAAEKGKAVDLFEIFEAGWCFHNSVTGHVFDGRDVCRLTSAEFWPDCLKNLHADSDLQLGDSKLEAIAKLKAEIRNRLYALPPSQATEENIRLIVNSLIESARCLGVAQCKDTSAVVAYWDAKVNEYRDQVYALPQQQAAIPDDSILKIWAHGARAVLDSNEQLTQR